MPPGQMSHPLFPQEGQQKPRILDRRPLAPLDLDGGEQASPVEDEIFPQTNGQTYATLYSDAESKVNFYPQISPIFAAYTVFLRFERLTEWVV